VPELIRTLEDSEADTRQTVAWALGCIGPPAREAVAALTDILQRGERYVRDEAAWALGCIGPEAWAAVPELIRTLEDSEADTRQTVAWALGCIGPEARAAVPVLSGVLRQEEHPTGRIEAALALWKVDGQAEAVVPVLVAAMRDANLDVCHFAVEALACVGPPARDAVPELRRLLDGRPSGQRPGRRERQVYDAAAQALRNIDPTAAKDKLVEE
jgi:HEAT repeat protein